jgi:hypothetical protein
MTIAGPPSCNIVPRVLEICPEPYPAWSGELAFRSVYDAPLASDAPSAAKIFQPDGRHGNCRVVENGPALP